MWLGRRELRVVKNQHAVADPPRDLMLVELRLLSGA
jgi:hypothetical protein